MEPQQTTLLGIYCSKCGTRLPACPIEAKHLPEDIILDVDPCDHCMTVKHSEGMRDGRTQKKKDADECRRILRSDDPGYEQLRKITAILFNNEKEENNE